MFQHSQRTILHVRFNFLALTVQYVELRCDLRSARYVVCNEALDPQPTERDLAANDIDTPTIDNTTIDHE